MAETRCSQLYGQISERISFLSGESFELDQMADPETGEFVDIGVIHVRRGQFKFSLAFCLSLQEESICDAPVLMQLDRKLAEFRDTYHRSMRTQ